MKHHSSHFVKSLAYSPDFAMLCPFNRDFMIRRADLERHLQTCEFRWPPLKESNVEKPKAYIIVLRRYHMNRINFIKLKASYATNVVLKKIKQKKKFSSLLMNTNKARKHVETKILKMKGKGKPLKTHPQPRNCLSQKVKEVTTAIKKDIGNDVTENPYGKLHFHGKDLDTIDGISNIINQEQLSPEKSKWLRIKYSGKNLGGIDSTRPTELGKENNAQWNEASEVTFKDKKGFELKKYQMDLHPKNGVTIEAVVIENPKLQIASVRKPERMINDEK